ncbi:MAG TPA: hypothetical protein VFT66_04265 [Roseiflexaceae bacterium]|jgi:hypothetical protein|nr:hypothetical protein [Roseiflexaceae bacterium]
MTVQPQAVDPAAIEQLVSQVRGVLAVRVVNDEQGQIAEVHVVGTPERSPKAMVRDVESLLFVRGGVRVSHRKISLVQLEEGRMQAEPLRLQLVKITQTDGPPTAIHVTLALGEQHIQGIGTRRPGYDDSSLVLAGYATIHALNQMIGSRGQFRVEQVQRQLLGTLSVCLAQLSFENDEGVETFIGVSMIHENELMSAARAILDAVNRRLTRLMNS